MAFRPAALPILFSTAVLAGCWSLNSPAVQTAPVSAAPGGGIPPPASLAGYWTLNVEGGGSCAMNFGALPDPTEGTIAPTSGCPYNFSTSRKWTYATAGLVIRDQKTQTLAQLSPVGTDRFEGTTSDGQEISLSRQ